MFRQPAFTARQNAAETQREALLAEQRVAAVAAAERRDHVVARDVRNECLVRVTRPAAHDRSYKTTQLRVTSL